MAKKVPKIDRHKTKTANGEDVIMFDVNEVAEYLGISVTTVYRKLKDHSLPATKCGRQWRFYKHLIDDMMIAQSQQYLKHQAEIKPKEKRELTTDEKIIAMKAKGRLTKLK
ncbi:MAG: helix-turn-helix domain-containing protein [Elusimicrobiota bacterium]|nr:helix-turn-helix domain-containing protein [Elusimicrobiota bacterium]